METPQSGTIFSIEEFAINDGPGIRTTVFLKGCPLRCQWCHNPEGLDPNPQSMMKNGKQGICGEVIDSKQLAQKLLHNKDIYRMNQGGVTFTGGEPLMQADFLEEVLQYIHPEVHCAMETSGYASEGTFRRILKHLDYVLMDLKHTDSLTHAHYTRVSNIPILNNLEVLKASGKEFVIRVPLIPGVNDSIANMKATRDLLTGCPTLKRVELLRYNKLAGAKHASIGTTYAPEFDPGIEPQIHDVFTEADIDLLCP